MGPQGEKGDAGPSGAPGEKGEKGDPGATDVTIKQLYTRVAPGETKMLKVSCDPGYRATGGGGNNQKTPGVNIIQSAPDPPVAGASPTGWQVSYDNTNTGSGFGPYIFAYAICAAP